ncbi:MAG: hypothetical protein ACLVLI_01805, partial [Aedoeadaptatus pacaensis]
MDFILNHSIPFKKLVYSRDRSALNLHFSCEEGDWSDEFAQLVAECYPTLAVKMFYPEKKKELPSYTEDEIFDFLKTSIISSGAWLERGCFSLKESHITLQVPNATVEKTVLSMGIESRLEEITGRHYFLECCCSEEGCELKALE